MDAAEWLESIGLSDTIEKRHPELNRTGMLLNIDPSFQLTVSASTDFVEETYAGVELS